jgi:hypothetical protein
MLPILISVSVTTADTEAAAMINPGSPSERPSVLKKFLAQRFMNFLLGYGPSVTAFVGQFPQVFFLMGSTIAGVRLYRKAGDVGQTAIARDDLSRKAPTLRRSNEASIARHPHPVVLRGANLTRA